MGWDGAGRGGAVRPWRAGMPHNYLLYGMGEEARMMRGLVEIDLHPPSSILHPATAYSHQQAVCW